MNVLSLFDGMSCGMLALNKCGIKINNYYASEIDSHAIKISDKNYPNINRLGDVTNWKEWGIDWESIDLLIAGSPCQGFSLQGKQLAFNDPRSVLFFVFVDILNHIKSLNPNLKFMLENVKMKKDHIETITNFLGVEPVCINSALLSAQNRTRYYWANWSFSEPIKKYIPYDSVLEPSVKKFFPATARKGDPRPVLLTGDIFPCLTASYFKGVRADGRPAAATKQGVFDELRKTGDVRMLTPIECERLQTVPDNYTEGVSKTQRYKMLGNGWTINVIAHIFSTINN